jgi:UDP-glucuronate 4-epimerase
MTTLVTGAAGFIGFHVARALLARGEPVIGVDNLNDYYPVALKEARLAELQKSGDAFTFAKVDIADAEAMRAALAGTKLRKIAHMAAQAGVRYSIENPGAYERSNLAGHLNMLELARASEGLEAMTYASSSSVYGGNTKVPFSETDRVDNPLSLYAATKRAGEMMSQAYAHLYRLPLTGLRFFTVYGPWGRPDMAMWIFTKKILAGEPLPVFGGGVLRRDFTYIDDIIEGLVATLDKPAAAQEGELHPIYNIGNNRPVEVNRLIALIEAATGAKAQIEDLPRQPGDVEQTCADIDAIARDHGFSPKTPLEEGVPLFIEWYRAWHGV